MSDFRNKLIEDVVKPNQDKNRASTLIATVTNAKKSSYTIKFTNEFGEDKTQSGIKVRTYGNDTIGPYMPEVGDMVIVEQEDNEYTIIAKFIKDEAEAKNDLELMSDRFSNLFLDSIPGYIF